MKNILIVLFILGTIITLGFYFIYIQKPEILSALNFQNSNTRHEVSYYLDSSKLSFKIKDDKFIISNDKNDNINFNLNSTSLFNEMNQNDFFTSWHMDSGKNNLIPPSDCKYINITLISFNQKSSLEINNLVPNIKCKLDLDSNLVTSLK